MIKRRRFRVTIALLLVSLLTFAALPAAPGAAQGNITVVDQGWTANFRDHITFSLEAESSAEIVEASLFYQIVGQIATSRNEPEFTPGTSISATFEIDQTDPSNYSPPGTEMQYWWKLVDADGNELKTEKESLIYLDDRYDWQTLQNDRVTLYWYEGSADFAETLFERANTALDTLETDVGAALEDPIKIFIYSNHSDLLGALRTSSQEWTGGVAFTEFGVVVIGISPAQLDWGLNAMTHEMSHLVIHQKTDNPFGDLPRWLDEGIAVYNENRDELDQDFKPIFERAVDNNELMTLRTLSSPFPADPLLANLAYGHSGAVVKYIIDTYGPEAMAELLNIFSEGALYDEALEQALGITMDQLDNDFRASVGLSPLPNTVAVNAAEPDAVPEAAVSEVDIVEGDENSETVAPVEDSPAVEAVTETTAETEAEAPSISGASAQAGSEQQPVVVEESAGPFGLSCLTGVVSLFFVGAFVVNSNRRR